MQINLYATLRQIAGRKEVELSLAQDATLYEAILALIERHPDLAGSLLDEEGRLVGHVRLFINGRDTPELDEALQTNLLPDDLVDIFPAIAGGSLRSYR